MLDNDYCMELLEGNIAINCGKKSGGLISIDFDDDRFLEEFLELNPAFLKTTLTRAKRGGNLWLRLPEGSGIPKVIKIKSLKGKDLGEIRGTGGCTIVHGVHPDGTTYELKQEFPPIYMTLDDVNWPSHVKNPLNEMFHQDLCENRGEPFSGNAINEGYFIERTKLEYDLIWAEKDFHLYDKECGIWKLLPRVA